MSSETAAAGSKTRDRGDFWAVIPAGGAGTRLWPLSRISRPKFLLDLTGAGRTLLQQTADRLAPLAGERTMVITGARHWDAVAGQLPELDAIVDGTPRIVAEPSPRDSMAAIGLAAAMIERADPDAVMGSFAADHAISGRAEFERVVDAALGSARAGSLVTIGIEPNRPSDAFGYIRTGAPVPELPGVHRVEEFVEKPDVATAERYLAEGGYLWNAGMFVVRPTVLLDLLAQGHPRFAAELRAIAGDPDSLARRWERLPRIAIDHAVAEPAAEQGAVSCVPAAFAWDDIGDFDALGRLLPEAPVQVLGDRDLVHDEFARALVVPGSGRPIAVVGLEDVVVVDTDDALLVCSRTDAQRVKEIVAALRERGHDEIL